MASTSNKKGTERGENIGNDKNGEQREESL